MKERKKEIIIVLVIIVFMAAFSIKRKEEYFLSNDPDVIAENAENESGNIKESEMKEHTEIDIDTFLKYFEEDKKRVVLFARDNCYYCQQAEPIIKNLAYKYEIEINYIDTLKVTEEERERLESSHDFFPELSTPTLMIIKNKKIVDSVIGLTDTAHYYEFFKKNKIIK